MSVAGQLWQKYQDTRDEEALASLVNRYLPLVRLQAGRLALGLPSHVLREDLIQSGVLGLLEALRRFDPGRGIKFETYASIRIRGAMLDELRRLCWLPRSLVKNMRELDKAAQSLASSLGREPREDELAAELGISVAELQKLTGEINSASILSLEEALLLPSALPGGESDTLTRLLAEEEKEALAGAIEMLPERYRLILSLYYQEELTLKEIGQVLGISESRVCQLHARIIARLRTALS